MFISTAFIGIAQADNYIDCVGATYQLCNKSVANYARNIASESGSSSSNSQDYSVGASYAGFGGNLGYGETNSNSQYAKNRDNIASNYNSMNCEYILKSCGEVTIAQINADKEATLERMRLKGYLYGQDTLRAIEQIRANSQIGVAALNNTAKIMQTEILTRNRPPPPPAPDYNAELRMLRESMKQELIKQ